MNLVSFVGTLLMIMINFDAFGNCLECVSCGKYNTEDGSILPCIGAGEQTICNPTETYCMKYFNKGVVVRQCIDSCSESVTTTASVFCCTEDNCNSAYFNKPVFGIIIFLTMITISCHLLFFCTWDKLNI